MSSTAATPPEVRPKTPARPRKRLRKRRILAALAVVILVCVLTPAIFQQGVRQGVIFMAHRHGIDLHIEKVSGSIFEPISFYGMVWSSFSTARTSSRFEIARMDVDVSLLRLLFKRGTGSLRSISIDGMNSSIKIPATDDSTNLAPPAGTVAATPWSEKWIPSKIEATHVNFIFQRGQDSVELQNLRCLVSDREAGTLQINKITVKQSGMTKIFSPVNGVTAFQNSRISIANLPLQKNITMTNASSDLVEMASGRLKIDFDFAAFGGSVRGEIKSASPTLRSLLEANGDFKQISIQQLATFLDFKGESGGLINEGHFTFHGTLRDLKNATLSGRLEATDFLLGKRQWNSLVGGAMLLQNRLQINDLRLKQAHNELSLKGDMALPEPWREWWQSEFSFDIVAKIDNLTELSNLFGPDFADLAGKMTIDGSIKGYNQWFTGELNVTGSNLSYRTAPLDTLHASVKLNGNELQVVKLDLSSKNDFVRGSGVVNILGEEKRYSGKFNASVADLTRYSAIMKKPLVPQPVAGGLVVEWSGDGVAKAHSGSFHAQLKKFRLVSVKEPKAHPLSADVEATYSPGNIFFKNFLVWDDYTNFSAKVTVAPKTLNLQSMRLQHGGEYWLVGDAMLPFNVWSAWANASWASFLDFDSPCKFNLTAKNLDLHETSLLSGRELPVKGMLDVNLTGEGTLNDLKANGRVQLKKWQLALGESEKNTIGGDVGMVFEGQNLQIEKSQATYNAREFGVQGKIDLKNLHNPELDIAVSTKNVRFSLREDVEVNTELDLDFHGTYDALTVGGTAQLLELKAGRKPDALVLFSPVDSLNLKPVLPFDAADAPFNKWQYDVSLTTPQPVKLLWLQGNPANGGAPKYEPSGTLAVNGSVRGKGADARLSGSASLQNVTLSSAFSQLTVSQGTLLFSSADNTPTWLSLAVSGKAGGEKIDGWIYGSENEKTSYFFSNSTRPQDEIIDLIKTGVANRPPAIFNLNTEGDAPFELASPGRVLPNFTPATESPTSEPPAE